MSQCVLSDETMYIQLSDGYADELISPQMGRIRLYCPSPSLSTLRCWCVRNRALLGGGPEVLLCGNQLITTILQISFTYCDTDWNNSTFLLFLSSLQPNIWFTFYRHHLLRRSEEAKIAYCTTRNTFNWSKHLKSPNIVV